MGISSPHPPAVECELVVLLHQIQILGYRGVVHESLLAHLDDHLDHILAPSNFVLLSRARLCYCPASDCYLDNFLSQASSAGDHLLLHYVRNEPDAGGTPNLVLMSS